MTSAMPPSVARRSAERDPDRPETIRDGREKAQARASAERPRSAGNGDQRLERLDQLAGMSRVDRETRVLREQRTRACSIGRRGATGSSSVGRDDSPAHDLVARTAQSSG